VHRLGGQLESCVNNCSAGPGLSQFPAALFRGRLRLSGGHWRREGVSKQVRYRAAPRPEKCVFSRSTAVFSLPVILLPEPGCVRLVCMLGSCYCTSAAGRCFRSVAHFRRYACQSEPVCGSTSASCSAFRSHASARCREIGIVRSSGDGKRGASPMPGRCLTIRSSAARTAGDTFRIDSNRSVVATGRRGFFSAGAWIPRTGFSRMR
jgi:hypothetical protein